MHARIKQKRQPELERLCSRISFVKQYSVKMLTMSLYSFASHSVFSDAAALLLSYIVSAEAGAVNIQNEE